MTESAGKFFETIHADIGIRVQSQDELNRAMRMVAKGVEKAYRMAGREGELRDIQFTFRDASYDDAYHEVVTDHTIGTIKVRMRLPVLAVYPEEKMKVM